MPYWEQGWRFAGKDCEGATQLQEESIAGRNASKNKPPRLAPEGCSRGTVDRPLQRRDPQTAFQWGEMSRWHLVTDHIISSFAVKGTRASLLALFTEYEEYYPRTWFLSGAFSFFSPIHESGSSLSESLSRHIKAISSAAVPLVILGTDIETPIRTTPAGQGDDHWDDSSNFFDDGDDSSNFVVFEDANMPKKMREIIDIYNMNAVMLLTGFSGERRAAVVVQDFLITKDTQKCEWFSTVVAQLQMKLAWFGWEGAMNLRKICRGVGTHDGVDPEAGTVLEDALSGLLGYVEENRPIFLSSAFNISEGAETTEGEESSEDFSGSARSAWNAVSWRAMWSQRRGLKGDESWL